MNWIEFIGWTLEPKKMLTDSPSISLKIYSILSCGWEQDDYFDQLRKWKNTNS